MFMIINNVEVNILVCISLYTSVISPCNLVLEMEILDQKIFILFKEFDTYCRTAFQTAYVHEHPQVSPRWALMLFWILGILIGEKGTCFNLRILITGKVRHPLYVYIAHLYERKYSVKSFAVLILISISNSCVKKVVLICAPSGSVWGFLFL